MQGGIFQDIRISCGKDGAAAAPRSVRLLMKLKAEPETIV